MTCGASASADAADETAWQEEAEAEVANAARRGSRLASTLRRWKRQAFDSMFRGFLAFVADVLLHEPPYDALLPAMAAAPHISATTMSGTTVDARADAVGSYTIIDADRHRAALLEVARAHLRSTPLLELQKRALDDLMRDILPHVRLGDGQSPSMDDLLYYGCVMERGAYFPSLHWDTDWNLFPGTDGFQVWYLLEGHADAGEGNMFVAQTPELRPSDPPVRLVARGGRVRKTLNKYLFHEPLVAEYGSVDELALRLEYLAMQPGECFVFSKRTLHMSDPRPERTTRLALNFRVICRPRGVEHVAFAPDHPYCTLSPLHRQLKRRARAPPGSGRGSRKRLVVSRHEMLSFDARLLEPAGRRSSSRYAAAGAASARTNLGANARTAYGTI